MSGLELNKIAAAVLIAGLVAAVVGTVTDALYNPTNKLTDQKRGYQVAIEEQNSTQPTAEDVQIKIGQLMASADAIRGKEQASKCATCHNFDKEGATKIGPDLWDVVGAQKAKKTGFTYSSSMIAKGGEWGYEELFHFLESPRKFVPGTKMGFGGFKKSQDIVDTIAFLRSLSDKPLALPDIEK